MSNSQQNILYIGLAMICVFLLGLSAPKLSFTPKGIILPITKALPKINPDQVQIYRSEPMPGSYKALAYINIEEHYRTVSPEKQIQSENYAKKLAASIGANGLWILQEGYTGLPGQTSGLSTFVIHAKGIKL